MSVTVHGDKMQVRRLWLGLAALPSRDVLDFLFSQNAVDDDMSKLDPVSGEPLRDPACRIGKAGYNMDTVMALRAQLALDPLSRSPIEWDYSLSETPPTRIDSSTSLDFWFSMSAAVDFNYQDFKRLVKRCEAREVGARRELNFYVQMTTAGKDVLNEWEETMVKSMQTRFSL